MPDTLVLTLDRKNLASSRIFLRKAKTKYICGSYYMVLKNRVGR